ncbi:MAG: DotI/IcmL/TraM family protein [Alphaproteobacteria bacterium]|nr:DotI/IcmL/TraM family protein [Alphaproteobacteria bacterium]
MKFFLIAFSAVLLCFPLPAQAGIIEFFFPSLKEQGPDPSKTLIAPFADNAPQTLQQEQEAIQKNGQKNGDEKGLPENAIPLDFPHRTGEQVGEWTVMAASEAMTFDKESYEDSLKAALEHFDESGKQQYTTFLKDSTILDIVKSGKYYIRSFAQEHALLLNAGAVGGRYHWLYEIPMMISYMDRRMVSYKGAEATNQLITLTVQVGRTANLESGHDLAIELWSVKARKDPAKKKDKVQ